MTPAQRLFWERVQRGAARLQPAIAREVLRGFQELRDELGDMKLLDLLRAGNVERVISEALQPTTLRSAFQPVRERIREGVRDAVDVHLKDLPRPAQVGFSFDLLNPKVVDAIRLLESRVITTLEADIRDTVRQAIERGLRDGVNPRDMARELRDVIGLAPNQEEAVANFRAMLEEGDSEALTRALRDRRFDATVRRALAGDGLSTTQVDRMTDAYRRRMVSFNAETNARTAALDAQKLGQHLTWQAAIDRGDIDGGRLVKTWRGVLDDRERPEHVAMEGETVLYDEQYSNGQLIPGDSEYNCRCVSIFSLTRAA